MRPSMRWTVPIGTTANLSIFSSVGSSPDLSRRWFSSHRSPTVSGRGGSLGWYVLAGGKRSPVGELLVFVPMTADIVWLLEKSTRRLMLALYSTQSLTYKRPG